MVQPVRRLGVVRLVRQYECDGVARHQTPELCPRYGEDEDLAGIRRGLYPAGRKVDRCHSGLHGAVGVKRLDIGQRLRGDGCRDHPMVIIHEPVRV